jgi:uncharacterized cupredoxin-like copper-binding protein
MPNSIRGITAIATASFLVAACSGSASPAPTFTPTIAPNPSAAGSSSGAGAGGGAAAAGTPVTATESEFKIEASPASAAAGAVSFQVKNSGTQTHEFVVIRTDLSEDKLPTTSGGSEVDESASGMTVVDEVEDIEAGATDNLDVTLDAGNYVLICNIPGHYQLGMHTAFTVK